MMKWTDEYQDVVLLRTSFESCGDKLGKAEHSLHLQQGLNQREVLKWLIGYAW
jgi:hypothetical protein